MNDLLKRSLKVVCMAFAIFGLFIAGGLIYYFVFSPPTYKDASEFYNALEQGEVIQGDIVQAKVTKVEENEVLGYELWIDDAVVLIGENGKGVNVGDTIKFEVHDGQEFLNIWSVAYKIK